VFSWRIPGHQQYKSHSCHLNGDYSQAAVLCCAGALGHDITVTHLSPVTTQGDRAILRHLMALGATVEESDNHICVKAGKLHGATLDMHDCPDIAPILALTAQLAEGESRLTHCGRLRLKECDRLAAMPQGLDTALYQELDENGVTVSGGEAQKIAIARALYKDAPFIILDEPTAALDPVAEAEIYAKFNEIAGDKTAIYISHRLSSCKFCDEIAVFDHGEVIQQGTHERLLADTAGKYYELWNAQAQYYTEEPA
jgi:ABC-type molybdenum transport system ATPase subunit/photorepair protein PhrA